MLFNSIQFLTFFAFVTTGVYLLNKRKYQHLFLLIASYYFYYVSSREYVILMAISSIGNFYFGKELFRADIKKRKRAILAAVVVFNLGMLGFFKYTNFVISIINDLGKIFGAKTTFRTLSIVLPVGISFYTFQAMSYSLDIYFEKIKPLRSLTKFSLFVSFFPQLVAGPIVRASEFLPQLKRKITLTADNFKKGAAIALWGFIKKLAFADNIGRISDAVFSDPTRFSGNAALILAALAFSVQIYCDFSGYSDIAIGIARILGFKLPENFRRPYFSRNISEFWRRWHISLSFWIRDYCYTPLYAFISQRKILKKIRNLGIRTRISIYIATFISLLLIGIWHGAWWNYVFFGVYHGVLLVAYQMWNQNLVRKFRLKIFKGKIGEIPRVILTFATVAYGLMMFRIENISHLKFSLIRVINIKAAFLPAEDWSILKIILAENHAALLMLFSFAAAYAVFYFTGLEPKESIGNMPPVKWSLAMLVMTSFLYIFMPTHTGAFIYFQF